MKAGRSKSTVRKQPRQARAQATVGAILEATEQILDRAGLEAATMAHIAEVAGVSVGSIYQYFPHRDAILNALQDREFARALGTAVGKKPAIVSAPGMLLRLAARADTLLRGPKAKLTPDRAAYFSHRNWVVEPKRAAPPSLWQPQVATPEGLTETAGWYRAQGWL